jgi:hypothetical protein
VGSGYLLNGTGVRALPSDAKLVKSDEAPEKVIEKETYEKANAGLGVSVKR